jgi:hypothetical protein
LEIYLFLPMGAADMAVVDMVVEVMEGVMAVTSGMVVDIMAIGDMVVMVMATATGADTEEVGVMAVTVTVDTIPVIMGIMVAMAILGIQAHILRIMILRIPDLERMLTQQLITIIIHQRHMIARTIWMDMSIRRTLIIRMELIAI